MGPQTRQIQQQQRPRHHLIARQHQSTTQQR